MKINTSKKEEVVFFILKTGIMISFALVLTSIAYAQGITSPAECNNPTVTIDGNDNTLSYTAVSGIISGACIKSGINMFDGWHSGLLGNGVYEDGCYSVSGVGTNTVTIERTGVPSATCQTLSHVDVFNSPAPTPTPTPSAGATASPSPSPNDSLLPQLLDSASPTPSPSPLASATPTPTPTPIPSTDGSFSHSSSSSSTQTSPQPALEGAVLGASAELPATGTENLWLFTAFTSLISGTGLIALGIKKGQKKI
ncbi:hypothetical protein HYU93_04965 [Candidatus Daviesbacteria bacterium]|nr:hypothetical protein [Candidatus Daviesbacteria bacterium]